MKRMLEVCTDSLQSVRNAVEGGAERIELCSALQLGGLTPSIGLLQTVRQLFPRLTVHVLIRPCPGNFSYDRQEILLMERDIRAVLPYADGIVTGVLTEQGDVDMLAMECLVKSSEGRPVTFHRAFDQCRDPLVALEQIVALGCRRISTSGQAPSAEQGVELLRRLSDLAGDRLIIMPGGGVNPLNASRLLDEVHTSEIHGSCSCGTGVTDAETVRRILATI